jgi:flagellar L-ring protein FlgH
MNRLLSSFFNSTNIVVLILTLHFSTVVADSLWKVDTGRSMFADKKAHAVGDLITILIQESNDASKQNNTTTSKKASVDASIASFLYPPTASGLLTKKGQLPALKYSSANDFNGGGQINNSEKITSRLAVRVVDVLPNGNLIIEGRRQTAFSGEKSEAVLRGTVRSDDIAANNTVYSYNISDASIQFISKGTITDSQRKGWFTKILDKVSPF